MNRKTVFGTSACIVKYSVVLLLLFYLQVAHHILAWWLILLSTIRSRVDTEWPNPIMLPMKCMCPFGFSTPALFPGNFDFSFCLISSSTSWLNWFPSYLQVWNYGEVLEQWTREKTFFLPFEWNRGELVAWRVQKGLLFVIFSVFSVYCFRGNYRHCSSHESHEHWTCTF